MSSFYFVIVFLSGVFLAYFCNKYFFTFQYLEMTVDRGDERDEIDMGVCILSARDHFQQRQAIRNTWLSDLVELRDKRVKAVFVVGRSACEIPLDDRRDQYTCEKWTPFLLGDSDVAVFSLQDNEEKSIGVTEKELIHKVAFKVLHPVKLKRIGVLDSWSNPLFVTLWNGVTDEEIVSVTFSSKDPGISHKGYRYQAIQPLILPKGFQGEMTTNATEADIYSFISDQNNGLRKKIHINTAGDTLYLEGMKEDRTFLELFEDKLPLLTFMVSVEDSSTLKKHIYSVDERTAEWTKQMKQEEEDLRRESSQHDDILLVNLTDVYRQLPQKLLACHSWFYKNVAANYVMKTDDDCLVDLVKLMNKLDRLADIKKLWWGNFRDEWLVERHGKWQEKAFPSSIYPRFACGSGNVVSRDLHKWIAQNTHILQPYQGEDVSLGIWLAATGANFHQDSFWECSKSCKPGSYVLPELDVEEMYTYWQRRQKCGEPCAECPS